VLLATATYASVRSANRAARAAERSLLAGLRPALLPSRVQDPEEKVGYADGHWVAVPGGYAITEIAAETIYLAVALRNVGQGLAVLHGWSIGPARDADANAPEEREFRLLRRDIYVPAGDTGFWQGAFRDTDDEVFRVVRRAIERQEVLTLDLLYGDHEGGQRTISRFILACDDANGPRLASAARHWNLDRPEPR
jgi:hypothetical protein